VVEAGGEAGIAVDFEEGGDGEDGEGTGGIGHKLAEYILHGWLLS
jgi:hypothetical protein